VSFDAFDAEEWSFRNESCRPTIVFMNDVLTARSMVVKEPHRLSDDALRSEKTPPGISGRRK
jgi:hypothetical protein